MRENKKQASAVKLRYVLVTLAAAAILAAGASSTDSRLGLTGNAMAFFGYSGTAERAGDPAPKSDEQDIDLLGNPCGLMIGSGLALGLEANQFAFIADQTVSYTFSRSQFRADDYAIFQTHDPYNSTVIKAAVASALHNFTAFTPSQLATTNFNSYRVVVLNFDDHNSSEFATQLAAAIPALQDYVNGGGVLWIQAAIKDDGGTFQMPFGGTGIYDPAGVDLIVDPMSPMVTGAKEPTLSGDLPSYSTFSGLPVTAHIVVRWVDANGPPVLYDYIGEGPCTNPTPTPSPTPSPNVTPTPSPLPEMFVEFNGNSISDGADDPDVSSGTDFGSTDISTGSVSRTFTIGNAGPGDLILNGAPRVQITGPQSTEFTVTLQPAATVPPFVPTTFTVRFDPSVVGLRSAVVNIANNDVDENPFNFSIEGTGTPGASPTPSPSPTQPEMDVRFDTESIPNGSLVPNATNGTDFGNITISGGTVSRTFTVRNDGPTNLLLTGAPSRVIIGGANASEFTVTAQPASPILPAGSTTFTIIFDPSVAFIRTATVSIANNDADENPYSFNIEGRGTPAFASPTPTPTPTPTVTPTPGPIPTGAGQLIISEFRLSGPNGPEDEFIELYNTTGAAITVQAADNSLGIALYASNGNQLCAFFNGTVIPAGNHILCDNSNGYSLGQYPQGLANASYIGDVPDNAGIALINNLAGNISPATRLDAVGSTTEVNTVFREGVGYLPLTDFVHFDPSNYSLVRRLPGGCTGTALAPNAVGNNCQSINAVINTPPPTSTQPQDTNDNSADFILVDTEANRFGNDEQRLGAPGPQSQDAPGVFDGPPNINLLDDCALFDAEPNSVFGNLPVQGSRSLDIRRTYKNNSGVPIQRLRFRVVDITTYPVLPGVSDLRPSTSGDIGVSVDRVPCGGAATSVIVRGTTLEEPPTQRVAGGFNSSLSVPAVTELTPLASQATVDVRFLMGVNAGGPARFCVVAETVPVTPSQVSCLVFTTTTPGPTPTPPASPTPTPSPNPNSMIQLSADAYGGGEGGFVTVTVTRSGDISGTSIVTLATTDGSAVGGGTCAIGTDYLSISSTLTFNPGQTVRNRDLNLCTDTVNENTESFSIGLSDPLGAVLAAPSSAPVTILDTASQHRNPTPIAITQLRATAGEAATAAPTPYPSNITVTNAPANLSSIRVTLFDLSHNRPDDLALLLVGPDGATYVLMADAGGTSGISQSSPVILTFSDSAGGVLPNSALLTSGKFEPTSWETPVANFPAPAPPGPYIEPGNAVGGPVNTTLAGAFGGTAGNGTWRLYVRNDSSLPNSSGQIAGGWGLELIPAVEVSGRVTTPAGLGLRNAVVSLTDSSGVRRTATTSSFGGYSFSNVRAGENYTITVASKRYRFAPRNTLITDNISDIDFVGLE